MLAVSNRIHSKELDAEILRLRIEEVPREEIAWRLGIKLSKVKTSLSQQRLMLPYKDRGAELVAYAASTGHRVVGFYVDAATKIELECAAGHRFSMAPSVFRQGHGCNACWQARRGRPRVSKYSWKDVALACRNLRMKPPEFSGDPQDLDNASCRWPVECFCGVSFFPSFYDVLYGKVSSCGCVKSGAEGELADFVASLGFHVERHDRSVLRREGERPRELDVYLPKERFAVEFNGLHYHGELLDPEGARTRAFDKWRRCREVGVRLVTAFEDEWAFRRPKVKAFLRAALGKNERRVGARQCALVEVPWERAEMFLEEHHLQGAACGDCWGLELEGELLSLIAVRTPGPSRIPDGFSKADSLEIVRFCNRAGMSIAGGFSRLLAAVRASRPAVRCLITYSDNRWSEGGVYAAAGFVETGTAAPSYSYFKANRLELRQHRFRFRKSEIFRLHPELPRDQTEWELMKGLGYDRIWDCGTTKWVKAL